MRNLKSRGPSSVQAKGSRATIVTIRFVNKALHRVKKEERRKKKEEEEEDKTANIRSGWFDSYQCVLATLRPFSQVE